MKSLKILKSCGLDGISNEMLKHSSSKLKDAILKLFNLVLKSGHCPEIWKDNLITQIFKQVEKDNPNNYRGITVSSNLGKLFCFIINDQPSLTAVRDIVTKFNLLIRFMDTNFPLWRKNKNNYNILFQVNNSYKI